MKTALLLTIAIVCFIAIVYIVYKVNWKKETEDLRNIFKSKKKFVKIGK